MIGRKIAYTVSSVSDCYKNIKYEEIITEEVGFEPTDACTSLVFKTSAINHSTTLPISGLQSPICELYVCVSPLDRGVLI